MGKKILVQRRGRGSNSKFRAASHKRVARAKYRRYPDPTLVPPLKKATIVDFVHEPGRGSPLAMLKYEDDTIIYLPAVEGTYVGQVVEEGTNAPIKLGNILPLAQIPDGMPVCNVERRPGDGGAISRASGTFATLVSHSETRINLQTPSKEFRQMNPANRATIGIVAGGGRTEKPFLKAGNRYHLKKAKGHTFPRVRGVAMSAYAHPFGGGAHQSPHKPKTVSRHAPPGRKVGQIAAKRTGVRKG